MIPDAQYTYEALLRFNYFPMVKHRRDEVPPVFSTEQLTPTIADGLVTAPMTRNRSMGFDLVSYRATRSKNVVRKLDIPHPFPYAELCQRFRDNWSNLNYICANENSRINPEQHGHRVVVMAGYDHNEPDRVVVMEKDSFPADLARHLDLVSGQKYRVSVDVANCFPSLYSHSIPWALVGHEYAKTHRAPNLWFNQIDAGQRFLKRAETQGAPIGPATSNIINEIVLARVDEKLLERGYRFSRFIDDYICFTDSRDDAERFIRDVELYLDRFLLRLNAKKVTIDTLPLPHRSLWVNELNMAVSAFDNFAPNRVANLLDYAVAIQNKNPDASVIKYVGRMIEDRITRKNAAVFVRYLLGVAKLHPNVLPVVANILERFQIPGLASVIKPIIEEHLEFRSSDGTCWAIYVAFLANAPLGRRLCQAVVDSKDCLAMCMIVATDQSIDKVDTFLNSLDRTQPYELDQYWLLIYQRALANGAIRQRFNGYLTETALGYLRDNNVEFVRSPTLADFTRQRAEPFSQ
ncbi:MAG: RNA-directed DNA polymerase [Planctomycetaceae bacterium]|nr:RNA-directed DNA polymerase [Planctomycetaceae bacterium]